MPKVSDFKNTDGERTFSGILVQKLLVFYFFIRLTAVTTQVLHVLRPSLVCVVPKPLFSTSLSTSYLLETKPHGWF